MAARTLTSASRRAPAPSPSDHAGRRSSSLPLPSRLSAVGLLLPLRSAEGLCRQEGRGAS